MHNIKIGIIGVGNCVSSLVQDTCGTMMTNTHYVLADEPEPDMGEVVRVLKESVTQVVLNYLPVGSEQATRF